MKGTEAKCISEDKQKYKFRRKSDLDENVKAWNDQGIDKTKDTIMILCKRTTMLVVWKAEEENRKERKDSLDFHKIFQVR